MQDCTVMDRKTNKIKHFESLINYYSEFLSTDLKKQTTKTN